MRNSSFVNAILAACFIQVATVVVCAAGQQQNTVEAAKAAISRAPNDWRGYNQLGLIYHESRRYDEAIAAFEQALQLHPITITLEEEKRQVDAITAQNRAAQADAVRREKAQKDAETKQLFSTLLGGFASMPGVSVDQSWALNFTSNLVQTGGSGGGAAASPNAAIPTSQLKARRESADINGNLGMACYGAQRWSPSIAAFEKALEMDPARVNLLRWLSEANSRLANYPRAAETMKRYLSLVPDPPVKARLAMAGLLSKLGLDDDARQSLGAAIAECRAKTEDWPQDLEGHMELAAALVQAGRHADANTALLNALPLAGGLETPRKLDLATQLYIVGDLNNAAALALTALSQEDTGASDRAFASSLLGRIQTEQGQMDKARASFQQAMTEWKSRYPEKDLPDFLWIARTETGQAQEAATRLEGRYLENPTAPTAYLLLSWLALAYERLGQVPAAIVALNECLAIDPSFAPARRQLQRLDQLAGETRRNALEEADDALKVKDWSAGARRLAVACQHTAIPDERLAIERRLMAAVAKCPQPPALPERAQHHFLQGNAAFKSAKEPGDIDRAIAAFRWALLYAPESPSLHLNLSLAYTLRQRYREADENLKLYLAGNPADKNADTLLERLYEMEYQRKQSLKNTVQR